MPEIISKRHCAPGGVPRGSLSKRSKNAMLRAVTKTARVGRTIYCFRATNGAVVNRIAQEDARLRSRLLEPVVTALGATTTMSLEAVGREFLDQAWHRIKTGKLLVGDPDDTFSQIYAVIEPWILAEKALPYEALTLLYNVRVEGQIGRHHTKL